MKTTLKTIGVLVLVAVAIETVAMILKVVTNAQFIDLLKKTGLIAAVALVLGLILSQFTK